MNRAIIWFMLLFMAAGHVIAQDQSDTDISDAELAVFLDAIEEVQEIQQHMVSDTQDSVAKSTLDESRFQELLEAGQSGQAPERAPSEEEQQEFTRLVGEIQAIQQESNAGMVTAVREAGMEVRRYNEIAQTLQQDPDLMERLQSIQKERNS